MSITTNTTAAVTGNITIPPPPDLAAENKLLRYRVYAAEHALNAVVTALDTHLKDYAKPMLKKLWELNEKYPLGDDTEAGVRRLAVNAARAANTDTAGMTDDQVLEKYVGGPRSGADSAQGK